MLESIKKLFPTHFFDGTSPSKKIQLSQEQLHLACAALLIEVAIVDNHFDERELSLLKHILKNEFSIAAPDIEHLIESAHNESTESTSMFQFTRLVNDHCDFEDKYKLISSMWRIAYADGNLDKYEEYIIRKVSDLIYVSHGDFIRAKISVKNNGIE